MLPAARLEQLARIERLRRDADHRLAEARRDAGDAVRVLEVRRRLDDRLGAQLRVTRLEDAGADEDAVGPELHAERCVGGGFDAAGGDRGAGELPVLGDPGAGVVGRVQVLGPGVTAGPVARLSGPIGGLGFSWGTFSCFVPIPGVSGAGVPLLAVFFVQQWRSQGREPLLPFAVFKNRNFSLVTLVLAGMGFAILGFYLPLTIYLQSVLGLSAIDAGLIVGAQPLAMMITSGVASGLSQKVSGKCLLVPGLVVLAVGMGYVDWALHADAGRWTFIPGLVISGLGMGFVWTPVFSLATRDLSPELGGVASGVINTIQELGTVIASAVIGAVLQNRLAIALHDEAVTRSAQLPAAFRAPFVDCFSNAATTRHESGSGQTAGTAALPPGLQPALARTLGPLTHTHLPNPSTTPPAWLRATGV